MDNTSKKNLEDAVIIEEKLTNIIGEQITKKYSKGKYLGKGGFAKCYEFTNLENKAVTAAKIICKNTLKKARHRQKLLSEIKIHRALNHPHIVKFEHVFEDNDNVYILLEICKNQTLNDLSKRRKRLTEFEAQYYIYQIVDALRYLRKHKVIHRDLKLGNLFLSENLEIKLGDFGLAAKLDYDTDRRHTVCGTPNYLAPEVLSSKVGHSYEVDVWSLGVVLYAIVVGKPPFETPEVKMTYEKIKKGVYSFPDQIPLSNTVKDLITKIFVLEPSKRPTIEDCFEHPFLNRGIGIAKRMHASTLAMAPTKTMMEDMISKDNKREVENNLLKDKADETKETKTNNKNLTEGDSDIYVKKWVDYSSKYGLGYILTNGHSGVFFNDCTKIIYAPDKNYFEYIERRAADRVDALVCYTYNNYPKELHKKVTLLLHFRSYLEGIRAFTTTPSDNAQEFPLEERHQRPLFYLKKWMKTRHAVMLRLSNKIVQVAFNDKTEIILSSESKLVTYIDKKGIKSKYPISTALESDNNEMSKRLKYTKEILTHMLNTGGRTVNNDI